MKLTFTKPKTHGKVLIKLMPPQGGIRKFIFERYNFIQNGFKLEIEVNSYTGLDSESYLNISFVFINQHLCSK